MTTKAVKKSGNKAVKKALVKVMKKSGPAASPKSRHKSAAKKHAAPPSRKKEAAKKHVVAPSPKKVVAKSGAVKSGSQPAQKVSAVAPAPGKTAIAARKSYTSILQKTPDISHLRGKQKKYYDSLMQTRATLMEQIQFLTDEALNSAKNSSAERSGVSTHMADQGSDNFIHDMELGMLTDEADVLEMIEEAVQRLIDGEYGKCLDCGCKIAEERLEAKPHARFCVKCKTMREQNSDTTG